MNNQFKAFSRSLYDDCNLSKTIEESEGPYKYITKPIYENQNACYQKIHPYQQTPFFSIPSAKIDIESDLRNQKIPHSRCPELKYNPVLNCKDCTECNSGLPCGCLHCKEKKENTLECTNEQTIYTRINKSCGAFNDGQQMNRFFKLQENVQDINKIHANTFIGSNTRLEVKDAFFTAKQILQPIQVIQPIQVVQQPIQVVQQPILQTSQMQTTNPIQTIQTNLPIVFKSFKY